MKNAVNQPQSILVLGGASDIAAAIVAKLASPALRHVVLAVRRPDDLDLSAFDLGAAEISTIAFDATDTAGHPAVIAEAVERCGDLDVVIQAFGQLGPQETPDAATAVALATVNYVGAVSTGLIVAERLRAQGHGTLVVLSSVAGARTRASNFVYGSTKAGQDGFATGLGHALHGSGAKVMTVRPGYVRTSMSAGVEEAPFACNAEDVADAVVTGLRRGSSVVWVPGILRVVFGLLRFAPDVVWRKLDR